MTTRYAYAVGKIRALESRLLTKNRLERILESATVQDALRELEGTEYAKALSGIKNEDEIETKLQYELNKVYKLLTELSLNPELTNLWLISRDIDNIKIFLKIKLGQKEKQPVTAPGGLFSPQVIRKMVEDNNYKRLPAIISEAARNAGEEFNKHPDSQLVDILLDKAKYDYFFEVLSDSENLFLRELIERKIDLTNIKTFIRLKIRKLEKSLLEKLLIGYGKISKKIFLSLWEGSLDDLVHKLQFTAYARILKKGLLHYKQENSLGYLEKEFDDYLVNFIKQAKYVVFGLEPLVGYLIAKEYEIRNIRTIMLGKFNHLLVERIRKVLRQTYV